MTVARKAAKTSAKRPPQKQPGRKKVSVLADHGLGTWHPGAGEVGIRVRMYRVGFGDFFLLTFLDGQGNPLHTLIDCGVFKGTSQTGDIHSIEAAVSDMAQTTQGRLELIVMTHRHADHIAGFGRCADIFKKMSVGAVWMPVWESEYEPIAVKFQAELERTALALQRHFFSLGANATEEQKTALRYMENATGLIGAAGEGSNAAALAVLKRGFVGVTPKYYRANDKADLPKSLVEAGITCKVLGPPPLDDMNLMKLMDLQKGVGQYLAEEMGQITGRSELFARQWELAAPEALAPDGYSPASFREWAQPRKSWGKVPLESARRGQQQMEKVLGDSQPIAALMAAKQLNSFLNNQSLVLLWTLKEKNLLFVGDAQAGNWEHWLFETDTPDKKGTGKVAGRAREILTSLNFYKVGHHGSGNATPKAAAELMTSGGHRFTAMCSTEADVYGTEDPDDPTKGTEVPRALLLEKLSSQAALVRSDQIDIDFDGKDVKRKIHIELPNPIPGSRLEKGPIWVDCFL